ncbi:hypothetical protein AVL61_06620 [Kocuria rosea subsp. polaris]|uniref:DUF998 domain-containing protein n=1 Tax=Kocuria rosea subsp. polaris TaxID=136273 RepID=A0A0W8I9Z0_KOCRO|nr:hypothetical protein AVL61_06620 [Kocuria polaris]
MFLLDALLLVGFVLNHLAGAVDPAQTWTTPFRPLTPWNRAGDGSVIELFGHLQLALAAGLLFRLAARQKGHEVLRAWAGILTILMADDFFTLHERAGQAIAPVFGSTGLSATSVQELGGAFFWFVVAMPLSAWLFRAYRRSHREAQHASRILLWCASPLGIVALGYVLLSVLAPEHLYEALGLTAVAIRVAVKVLTTSVILLFASWWSELGLRGSPDQSEQ